MLFFWPTQFWVTLHRRPRSRALCDGCRDGDGDDSNAAAAAVVMIIKQSMASRNIPFSGAGSVVQWAFFLDSFSWTHLRLLLLHFFHCTAQPLLLLALTNKWRSRKEEEADREREITKFWRPIFFSFFSLAPNEAFFFSFSFFVFFNSF